MNEKHETPEEIAAHERHMMNARFLEDLRAERQHELFVECGTIPIFDLTWNAIHAERDIELEAAGLGANGTDWASWVQPHEAEAFEAARAKVRERLHARAAA